MTDDVKIYGWFENASDTIPTYDPPRDADCPYCSKPVHAGDVQTHRNGTLLD